MPTSSASDLGRSPNCRRCTFDDLYEQCSLHMTLYIASSAVVGRRPRMSRMRRYSSSLSPSSRNGCCSSGVFAASSTVSRSMARLRPLSAPRSLALAALLTRSSSRESRGHDRRQHTGEEAEALGGGAGQLLDRVLGVRHEADDAPVLAGHPRDVAAAAVRVAVHVAEHDAVLGLEPVEVLVGRDVAALPVLDRDQDLLALRVVAGPGGIGALDAKHLVAVAEVQVRVAGERAGQQAGLAEHLEAVAD